MSDIRVQATEYVVSAVPEESDAFYGLDSWAITVVYRGRDRWAVKSRSRCLSRSGDWSHEHIPSERRDDWLAEHRFTLDEALDSARRVAPTIKVNGMTVADVLRVIAADATP